MVENKKTYVTPLALFNLIMSDAILASLVGGVDVDPWDTWADGLEVLE